jgi:hypothetical protein
MNRSIYFTLTEELLNNEIPQFMQVKYYSDQELENNPNPTWQDFLDNQVATTNYGSQGIDKIHKATGETVKLFEFHVPSLLNKELLSLLRMVISGNQPSSNLDFYIRIDDPSEQIPRILVAKYLPNHLGENMTWTDLATLPSCPDYFQKDSSYYLNFPDIINLFLPLLLKCGYEDSPPLVAIYNSPEEVDRYLDNKEESL